MAISSSTPYFVACLILIAIFKNSGPDLGLQVVWRQMNWHITSSLLIFILYFPFYLFVIRISILKPYSAAIGWGLLTGLAVVIAEELYFRGMLCSFIQRHFSARVALLGTAVIFNLFHGQQGILGIITKTFTGWLWGSVRYSSGMIYLIFPIHYAFNTIWLLFEGNWNNPPTWGIYALSVGEFLLGLAIVLSHRRTKGKGS